MLKINWSLWYLVHLYLRFDLSIPLSLFWCTYMGPIMRGPHGIQNSFLSLYPLNYSVAYIWFVYCLWLLLRTDPLSSFSQFQCDYVWLKRGVDRDSMYVSACKFSFVSFLLLIFLIMGSIYVSFLIVTYRKEKIVIAITCEWIVSCPQLSTGPHLLCIQWIQNWYGWCIHCKWMLLEWPAQGGLDECGWLEGASSVIRAQWTGAVDCEVKYFSHDKWW